MRLFSEDDKGQVDKCGDMGIFLPIPEAGFFLSIRPHLTMLDAWIFG